MGRGWVTGGREAVVPAVLSLIIIASLITGLFGCSWRKSALPPPLEGTPIVIGIPLPLSGATAAFGEVKRNAYEMAAEEVNATGGVDGRPLELVFRDTAGEPGAAARVAEELITTDEVVMLAGEYSSACGLAVAAVAQRYRVPYLADSASVDALTQQKWAYVFRLNPPAGLMAQSLWSFLAEALNPQTVAVVHEDSEYGAALGQAMRAWCRDRGIALPVYETYAAGTLDFSAILTRVREADPEVVFMVSYLTDAVMLIRQARATGVRPRLFAGGAAGFVMTRFALDAGTDAEHVVTAASWTHTIGYPGAAQFAETYRARYGQYPTYHGASAHACVHVMADAFQRAASTDPERLRVALLDTDLMTVFGPVRFESLPSPAGRTHYTNQSRGNTLVLQVIDGRYETIWPPEAATAGYVLPDLAGQD